MYNPRVIPFRPCGRAHSPPTWAWYEQLQPEDLESGSEYCSELDGDGEDDEEYNEAASGSDEEGLGDVVDVEKERERMTQEEVESEEMRSVEKDLNLSGSARSNASEDMEKSESEKKDEHEHEQTPRLTSEMKGKQKAIDPPSPEIATPARLKKLKKKRRTIPISATKPILTIKSSQGFVWNQDLFIPSYIKDRYYMSTSPPNSSHAFPMLASSCDTLNDHELDVVEIRVTGNELNRFRS